MTTKAHLDELLRAAREDVRAEPAFFAALLEATLYAHVPRKQVRGRVRFCQFTHPEDGRTLLPIFTDKAKAVLAANGKVGVLAMPARTLLELTLGAIIVLNPNDERCILYPEELVTLLDQGTLPAFRMETVAETETVGVCAPTVSVDSLTAALSTLYRDLPCVAEAYLVEVWRGPEFAERSLIVGASVVTNEAEHATRAAIAVIQPVLPDLALPVLVSSFPPNAPVPGMYAQVGPFYIAGPLSGRAHDASRMH